MEKRDAAAAGISRLQRQGDVDLSQRHDHAGTRLYSGSQLTLTVKEEAVGEKWILALGRKKTWSLSPTNLCLCLKYRNPLLIA